LIQHVLHLLHSMRSRRPLTVLVGLGLVLATAPAVMGLGIDPATLNPAPPDFYTCRATDGGAICNAHTVDTYAFEATGIVCGSGGSSVELLDSGIRDVRATRWYDRDLNLVRRQRTFLFRDTYLTNRATGVTLTYSQHNTDNEVLATPGDPDSSTLYSHGHMTMTAPGFGTVVLDAGQVIVGPSGDLEFRAGPSEFGDYLDGRLDVIDDLCAALGTPNS